MLRDGSLTVRRWCDRDGCLTAAFEVGTVERVSHLARLVGVRERVGPTDQAAFVEVHEALVERLHAVEVTVRHLVLELAEAVGLRDAFGDARVHHENLERRHAAAAAGTREQSLRDDPAQRRRDRRARLALLVRLEHIDEAFDGVDRAHRRQTRQHEVARLRGLERGPCRCCVAQLAHHDHVGVLAQRVHERRLRARRVGADFALVDHRALVGVQDLDRVLDRDDVGLARRVHVVDHRSERRRLPRTCEPGDQHEAVRLVGERGNRSRKRQCVEAGDAGEDPPQHEADPAALAERARAKPAEAGDVVHEVCLVGGGERGPVRRRHDRECARLGVRRFDGVEGRLAQLAVDAQARPRANLDVHVGSTLFHSEAQQAVEVQHVTPVSTGRRGL